MQGPPYVIIEPLEDGKFNISGYNGEIWNLLRQQANFTFDCVKSNDGFYGAPSESGEWNGLIKMLHDDLIDVAAADFYQSHERSHVTDSSLTLKTAFAQLIIRRPSQASGWYTFIDPVKPYGWIIIFVLWFCCTLTLFVITKLTWIYLISPDTKLDMFRSCFITLAAQFQQGTEFEPSGSSTRIAFFSTLISSIIIFALYSASLTSFLAISKFNMPFEDLVSMYRDTDYYVGSLPSTYFTTLFSNGSPLERIIYKERFKDVPSVNEALKKALDEDFAFAWEAETVSDALNLCTHVAINKPLLTVRIVNLFNKNYEFRQIINFMILKMRESGKLKKLWKSWKTLNPNYIKECLSDDGKAIGIFNLIFMFVLMGSTAGFSVIILSCELLMKRRQRKIKGALKNQLLPP